MTMKNLVEEVLTLLNQLKSKLKIINWWSFKKIARIIIQIKLLNKIKVLKLGCQKHFTKLQKMKNPQSKLKPIKVGKQSVTTYCFGCKDYTKNVRPQEVKMTNKALREKSQRVVCWSNKSRFLKQKIN